MRAKHHLPQVQRLQRHGPNGALKNVSCTSRQQPAQQFLPSKVRVWDKSLKPEETMCTSPPPPPPTPAGTAAHAAPELLCRRGATAPGTKRCETESQDGRGWQGPLWVTQPNPLPKQGHPEQAAQHRGQVWLEYLQRRRLHSLPGQSGPGLRHPQREVVLPRVQLELPLLQFVPIAPCPVAGHH